MPNELQHFFDPTEAAAPDYPAAANDNRSYSVAFGRSQFPQGTTARIVRAERPVVTSGKARSRGWRVIFERRTPHVIDPLMGYSGGTDTLTQIELNFPTLEAAIDYCERQALTYVVQGRTPQSGKQQHRSAEAAREQAFDEFLSAWLWLCWFQTRYGIGGPEPPQPQALDLDRALLCPDEVFATPTEVVAHPALTHEDKRNILRNWAWSEYLADLATAEGMPDGGRDSRLHEVELALLDLEKRTTQPIAFIYRTSPELRLAA